MYLSYGERQGGSMIWNMLFHIDEIKKWPLVIGNINNFLNEIKEQPHHIYVIANADAVAGVMEENLRLQEVMHVLRMQGVYFEFCRIALRGHAIQEADLPIEIKVVPSGVKRIVELQMDGYAYIRP